MRPNRKASLKTRSLDEWLGEYIVIDYGMIVLCRDGEADIRVNFTEWEQHRAAIQDWSFLSHQEV